MAKDILIVDDDKELVEILVALLERHGYRCRGAKNGQEALDVVAHAKPALVLLDLQMPIMNGPECARRLREAYSKSIAIVAITSLPWTAPTPHFDDADDLLPKPFTVGDLMRTVARYVVPKA